ncbi:MAG TPA: choice-of-anchor P family protein, partial [Acidimicrobiales bacterium]|nr:choice-of-anchor P family protein [Acidimicrobiales bacterium]
MLRSGRRLALLGVVLAVVLPAGGPAGGQDGTGGYDFYSLRSIGDGVTVDFQLVGFLPIEDLVGLSSVTAEAHYGVGRSDALAALPDPGDLVLTLPGTLSALAGVSGLPDYPAAAHASHPSVPSDLVELVPDADLGAGRLRTEAGEEGAEAEAFVGHQVDTIGLLPSFSVGTIRTIANTRRAGPTTLLATATTEVSDLRLLGGLVRIGHLTSTVSVGIVNDEPTAEAPQVDVSGVTVAGTPVGITDDGIVGLGPAVALAPVIDSLVQPLVEQGISIRTTPATRTVGERTATASGGAVEIEVPLDVQGYPGTLVVTFGRAAAEL